MLLDGAQSPLCLAGLPRGGGSLPVPSPDSLRQDEGSAQSCWPGPWAVVRSRAERHRGGVAEQNKRPFVVCPGALGHAGTHCRRSQQPLRWSPAQQQRAGRWLPEGCRRLPAPVGVGLTYPLHRSALPRALQHTNLLQCLAQCAEVTPYLLVMEFCPLVSPCVSPPHPVPLLGVLPWGWGGTSGRGVPQRGWRGRVHSCVPPAS